jgi:hypothetical protein
MGDLDVFRPPGFQLRSHLLNRAFCGYMFLQFCLAKSKMIAEVVQNFWW